MRSSTLIVASAFADSVACFPALANVAANGPARSMKRQVPTGLPAFSADHQYVSTSGKHEFVAPNLKAGDQRGPCPGLNAMANHGYIPHNGVATHADFITGTFEAFGMSPDLSGFLTILGGLLDGDGLSWSIGGPAKEASLPLLGAVSGQPQGISGSHNKYECDVSPTRGDLFTTGNDFALQMNQYKQLESMAKANGDIVDIALLNEFRSMRFEQSVKTNPYFFNGPFTGLLVQPAAYYFIHRFMGNKSATHPDGLLSIPTLRSLFAIAEAKDGTLVHTPGHERIPSSFYKRALGDEYSITSLGGDIIRGAAQYPKFLTVGGNTGAVNSLAGVNLEDLSGGVFNTKNLLQGNNLFCFASQVAAQALPDQVECSGLVSGLTTVLESVSGQLAQVVGELGCPQLGKVQFAQFDTFPGYENLDCRTGTY